MSQHPRPRYTDRSSTQTLRQGLEEYYAVNLKVTDPRSLQPEFAKILLAHDVSHVVYGCDKEDDINKQQTVKHLSCVLGIGFSASTVCCLFQSKYLGSPAI